ncbi:type II secretion system protein [Metabacillus fastidiosus]|uniref:type II secretion system protein n=1 Tax=Metabacillus fastidiosus TaxID=1458 RepID=UPI002DBD145F|nr:type II secretion system protein [Metabacillus fastidiosus]MEC2076790.1 type II secretion system protein [Metabacillus fastidiosus]
MKNQRGLTLIELLAVIVILGIIAAIAVPAVNAIMNKSKEDALVVEARNVVNAAKMYVADKKPGTNVTFSKTAKDQKDHTLADYLDNAPDTYSLIVTYDTTKSDYTYGNVTLKKDDKSGTYDSATFKKQ